MNFVTVLVNCKRAVSACISLKTPVSTSIYQLAHSYSPLPTCIPLFPPLPTCTSPVSAVIHLQTLLSTAVSAPIYLHTADWRAFELRLGIDGNSIHPYTLGTPVSALYPLTHPNIRRYSLANPCIWSMLEALIWDLGWTGIPALYLKICKEAGC